MAPHSSTLAWKIPMDGGAWWAAVHGVAKSWTRLSDLTFTSHFHALEKEMATHSSVLAWRIPGNGEPGGLPSMGLHRVGHDWSDLAACQGYYRLVIMQSVPTPPPMAVRASVKWLSNVPWTLSLWLYCPNINCLVCTWDEGEEAKAFCLVP